MGGQLATGSSIFMASAGVPAADSAGLSSIKSFSQLLTSIAAMPLAGGTFTGNVLFTDNTYDIGASGATRPRTVYAGTSVITPLLNNTNAAALTLGNSTYGVTVPGAATFSGDISMSKTSAQGYIYAYDTTGAKYIRMYQGSSSGHLVNTAGRLYLQGATSLSLTAVSGDIDIAPSSGNVYMAGSGGNGTFVVYDADASTSIRLANDGTDGKLSTTSGSIIYTPANGLAYQFTSGTDSQFRVYNAAGTKFLAIGIATANDYCSIQSGGTNMKLTLQEADGRPLVVGNTGTAAAKFHVRADATAGSGLPVRIDGVTGNGSNLTEWGLFNSTTLAAITSTGSLTCAGITASGVVSHGAYTVATLPAAGSNAGKMAQVTDSNVAASGNYGATVAAGGANRVKVFSDGTNWVIA